MSVRCYQRQRSLFIKSLLLITMLLICSISSASSSVPDDRIVGTVDHTLPGVPVNVCESSALLCSQVAKPKHIRLLKINLSKAARASLSKRLHAIDLHSPDPSEGAVGTTVLGVVHGHVGASRYAKQLGMAGIPAFDQGAHGSCVTFASTAAIDALFKLHDEAAMSPLCFLQLSRTLQPNSPNDGYWESAGSTAEVQSVILAHGFMPMQYQHVSGCGGLNEYPVKSSDIGQPMDVALYDQSSDHRFTAANQDVIFPMNFDKPRDASSNDIVAMVKHAIRSGHRVVIGSLVDIHIPGIAGAQGRHYAKSLYPDTWMVTPSLRDDIDLFDEHLNYFAGHALLVTGYDDKACAITDQHQKQCGLFTLRNSWGSDIGHHGDFYMSYAYLQAMLFEAVAFKPYVG